MMLPLLIAASLFGQTAPDPTGIKPIQVQETGPSLHGVVVVDIADLCGLVEIRALRDAILNDDLARAVRIASLDRYTKLLKEGSSERKAEEIMTTITEFVEPAATEFFKAELAGEGSLALNCVPAQLQWVERYLEGLRRSPDGLILVETLFFDVPAGHRNELLGARSGQALTSAEAAELEAKIKKLDAHSLLTAPEVLVNQGARASISVMEETAYVSDFVLTVMPDLAEEVCDPVIKTVQEGLVMNVRSILLGASDIDVHVDFESTKLRRPIAEYKRSVGSLGGEFSFQVPETKKVQAAARFALSNEGVIVLGASNPSFDEAEDSDTIIFIRAKLVDDAPGGIPLPPSHELRRK